MKKSHPKLPKSSATAKAIQYALNLEVALKKYTADGKVEIDNNLAERAMRIVAIGRKNYLFAGSDAGGEFAANIYTLTETAKANLICQRSSALYKIIRQIKFMSYCYGILNWKNSLLINLLINKQ